MVQDGILVNGFGFSGYRSFPDMGAPFVPLAKVNMLAGQNNAGKSNVLRFMRDLFRAAPEKPSLEFDRPQGTLPQNWQIRMDLYVPDVPLPAALAQRGDAAITRIQQAINSAPGLRTEHGLRFRYLLENAANHRGQNLMKWTLQLEDIEQIALHLRAQRVDVMGALNLITGQNYVSGDRNRFTAQLLESLAPNLSQLPGVRIIQAFRQIRPRADDGSDLGLFDGIGLVERLQQLESPNTLGTARDEARAKYEKINRFVRHILDDSTATLHIPYDASTIQVERAGVVLPLDSLGTGVHQVVMLAAAATLLDHTIVALEEPEVHLHPLLQRRLVRYLAGHTHNQYLIATHSAHLLDYEAGRVFHLTYTADGTEVAPAATPHELAKLCADLGYRPSDLLQSNAVIWVEGPSDRIYIRRWISDCDPELVEGIHYSIMFYGGGLLRHLSPEDPSVPGLAVRLHEEAVDDFISLRRLNRHLAVVIDSDKRSAHKHLNATKARVRRAFEESDGPGIAWITDGYTIENYVPRELLERAAGEVHPTWQLMPDEGQWANPLRFEDEKQPDKVAIARFVTDNWPAGRLAAAGLQRPVLNLVNLIRTANGHASLRP